MEICMNKSKKNINLVIVTLALKSLISFLIGVMYMFRDEFYVYKPLIVLNIIPISIGFAIPFLTKNLKLYSTAIYGILFAYSFVECMYMDIMLSTPYANTVAINYVLRTNEYNHFGLILNMLLVFSAFASTITNEKLRRFSSITLIGFNIFSVLAVWFTDSYDINIYDYAFSFSYILILLCAFLSCLPTIYKQDKTNRTKNRFAE